MFSYMTLFFFWEKGKYMEAWAIVLTRVLPKLLSTRTVEKEEDSLDSHKIAWWEVWPIWPSNLLFHLLLGKYDE